MGNLCIRKDYEYDKNYAKFHPKFSQCVKCGIHFRLPDRYNYPRRGCAVHNFKNGVCLFCKSKDHKSMCYHVPKSDCIIM